MRTIPFARILTLLQSTCPNYDKGKIRRVGQTLGIRDSSIPFSRWGRASLPAFSTHASSHARALSAPSATQPFHLGVPPQMGEARAGGRRSVMYRKSGSSSTAKCQPKSAVRMLCWKAVGSQRPQLRGMETAINTDFLCSQRDKGPVG